MADRYATTFVGVKDGTKSPPDRADGRLVSAKRRTIVAPKAVVADAAADRIFIGTIPQGATVREIRIVTDTSLGTATLSVGPTATPAKYVAAATVTTPLNVPVILGPRAAPAAAAPSTADEDLWVTVGVAALPGAAVVVFETDYLISA